MTVSTTLILLSFGLYTYGVWGFLLSGESENFSHSLSFLTAVVLDRALTHRMVRIESNDLVSLHGILAYVGMVAMMGLGGIVLARLLVVRPDELRDHPLADVIVLGAYAVWLIGFITGIVPGLEHLCIS